MFCQGLVTKNGDKPVPMRSKRAKSASSGEESPFLTALRVHAGMMDIIDHIGKESGIDDAIVYDSTAVSTYCFE